jgi:hypothetical protein
MEAFALLVIALGDLECEISLIGADCSVESWV